MNNYYAKVEFTTAIAYRKDRLFVAAAWAEDEPFYPFTVWYVYIESDKEEPWSSFHTQWCAVSATTYIPTNPFEDWALVGMSQNGEVHFIFENTTPQEKIPGAGVGVEDSQGLGYVSAIKQIGDHLYVCGSCAQVYKRVSANNWVHIDEGILQSPDVDEAILLYKIDGAHENAIYVIGLHKRLPKLFFWNGEIWKDIKLPKLEGALTDIYIESETRVWVCGWNGLLVGNSIDGFKNLSTSKTLPRFYSLCKFNEYIYLASALKLFMYNPNQPELGIQEVEIGLVPEVEDFHVINSTEGVLWSIGIKDIVKFDGEKWERIYHPDNPPIK